MKQLKSLWSNAFIENLKYKLILQLFGEYEISIEDIINY